VIRSRACDATRHALPPDMKILHTSDWHIGKRLGRHDRMDEFVEVLAEVEDLPQDLARRLVELVEAKPEDRAQAIRRLIEEHSS